MHRLILEYFKTIIAYISCIFAHRMEHNFNNMNKKLVLFVFLFFAKLSINAQIEDPVVLTINGKPIYKSEVERAYSKDSDAKATKGGKSFNDFLQSYIDFRLNVEEALAQQLDTTASYKREYYSYKAELGRSYMKDTITLNSQLESFYQRMQQDVDVNHVLIPFKKEGMQSPSDTLQLYQEALSLRQKLLSNGFKGEGLIDNRLNPSLVMDLSAVNGRLGWITTFMLPLKLEDAVYNIKQGDISMPIRTQRGYHLIQVLGKRAAIGAVRVDQVLFKFPTIPPKMSEIDSVGALVYNIYDGMKGAEDFQSLCDSYTKAYQTGEKKCAYGVIKLDTQNSPSFVNTALSLKNIGDISEPVMTDYGFHILRLVAKMPIPDFDNLETVLRNMIVRGDRGENYRTLLKQRLEQKFGFEMNPQALAHLQDVAAKIDVDDPQYLEAVNNHDQTLFVIAGENSYMVKDFLAFVKARASSKIQDDDQLPTGMSLDDMPYNVSADKLNEYLNIFTINKLYNYGEETLEARIPDFDDQMKEYSEGILLFDVKNKNIWGKAQADEAGLAAKFEKNKSKYKWDEPLYKGVVFYCKDEETMKNAEALYKEKGMSEDALLAVRNTLNGADAKVIIESDTWRKGENAYVDNKVFGENKEISARHNFPFVTVVGRFISQPEDFRDVRSAVEEDYQKDLDARWISSLRKKYKVEQNKSVLKSIERNK